MTLLSIQAYNNDFEFNGKTYLQIHGTAMGKRWAPSLADLYMAKWEEKLTKTCQENGVPFPHKCWFRYLDDIFTGWEHDLKTLETFTALANSIDPNIKVTFQTHPTQIDFLDTTLYKGPRFAAQGILDHKSYSKPTDSHQYLHAQSYHPHQVHKGLVKGMFIRLRRLNNNQQNYLSATKEMFQFFLNRGYKNRTLRKIFNEVNTGPYTLEHFKNRTHTKKPQRVPAVIVYNKNFKKFPKILRYGYNAILRDCESQEEHDRVEDTLNGPCMVAYKRSPNLKNLL